MKTQFLLIIVSFLLFPVTNASAQITEVKQTVFGMDCSPCAHGLEKRIKKMDGVKSASVSLNDGQLTASFTDDNTLTLKEIRSAIKNSGFDPKSATIKVRGKLFKPDNSTFILKTNSREEFFLVDEEKNHKLMNFKNNETILVSGKTEISEEVGIKLILIDINKSPK